MNGSRMLGSHPDDLSEEGPVNIGRGRPIPTPPLEAAWKGIAQWMGVADTSDLDYILPNRGNFDQCLLFADRDIFTDCSFAHSSCSAPPTLPHTLLVTTASVTPAPTTLLPTLPSTHPPTRAPTHAPTDPPTALRPTLLSWAKISSNDLEGGKSGNRNDGGSAAFMNSKWSHCSFCFIVCFALLV